MAAKQGLILVDTKYEFGLYHEDLMLIYEIHTPDSSRFFYLDSYDELQQAAKPQKQLSKEFVREWLMSEGFQGLEGQLMPDMNVDMVNQISSRYQELYRAMTGAALKERSYEDIFTNMQESIELGITKLT